MIGTPARKGVDGSVYDAFAFGRAFLAARFDWTFPRGAAAHGPSVNVSLAHSTPRIRNVIHLLKISLTDLRISDRLMV